MERIQLQPSPHIVAVKCIHVISSPAGMSQKKNARRELQFFFVLFSNRNLGVDEAASSFYSFWIGSI